MKFSKKYKIIAIGLTAFLVVAQFFPIDKTNPDIDPDQDIFAILEADQNIQSLIHQACFDCHSNKSEYPWYTNIAPLSWWIKGHINGGREHLNFSLWGSYSDSKREHKLEECEEMVSSTSMPLGSYKLLHPEARLSKEERVLLTTWFKSKM